MRIDRTAIHVVPLRGVIFDLDGTLVDTVDDIAAALNTALREDGLPPLSSQRVQELVGYGARALVEKALRIYGVEPRENYVDEVTNRYLNLYYADPIIATVPFPFATKVLATLAAKGLAIGICTNKPEKLARLILERLSLDVYIDVVIASDSGYGQKPNPRPLLACASQLEVSPAHVVYVGDHIIDVDTARSAGISVVAVGFGYSTVPVRHLKADREIDCLSELPEALSSLFGECNA